MKKAEVKSVTTFILAVMIWATLGIAVYGGPDIVLINDDGGSPGSWKDVINELASAASLKNGPSRGNPGSFYYFKSSEDGTREMSDAVISQTIALSPDQRKLCSKNQLKVNFSMDYFGWEDGNGDDDRFVFSIYSIKADGKFSTIFSSSSYNGDKSWRRLNMPEKMIPADTVKLEVAITAFREDGSDLDVYLDNIRLSVRDDFMPVMLDATVTEIRDAGNAIVPLKVDSAGNYLENWVNGTDKIYGSIAFNEPVSISYSSGNLNTNVLNQDGSVLYAVVSGSFPSSSESYQYAIPLSDKSRLKDGDNTVKFVDSPVQSGSGPFNYPVRDLGGNQGLSDIKKPNIDRYNIKLDTASPSIITPADSYEEYTPGRTSVDIVISEENMGTEQSPLTLTYYWEYLDANGRRVREPEKDIFVSSVVVPVRDAVNTVYTVKMDIPYGGRIPPYQEFKLYAEVNDEARNHQGVWFSYFKVNQKDNTPPSLSWSKSVYEDGTIIDLVEAEDTAYVRSRSVSFSVADLESGVEEVKYFWTKEPYAGESGVTAKMVLPGEEGRYVIQGTSRDTPLEGKYYLNILAVNKTETNSIAGKAFYFDNQGPRVNGDVIYEAGNPVSARFQVQDRALQSKFLYTLLASDSGSLTFEAVTEPDISAGLKDDGMWKVLDLESSDEGVTANITGVLDKITKSGYYKLVTRYYDEFYNCTERESTMWYDFIAPELEVIDGGVPSEFKKNHEAVIKVVDNMGYIDLWGDGLSVNWVNIDSGLEYPASYEIEPQLQVITVRGNDEFNGKYCLKVAATDGSNNSMEEYVFISGSRAEYCFDNSPPAARIVYDNGKAAKTIKFAYSELEDEYSELALFRYGLSNSAEGEPSEWVDIYPASDFGEIVYPAGAVADGEWYLSVLLQDTHGNEQIIRNQEPFIIDSTNPSGNISFSGNYTNKLAVPLYIEIDELAAKERKAFKAAFSFNEEELQSPDWKDITFENGSAVYSMILSDTADGVQRAYARFMDEAGNLSPVYSDSIILDRTAPTGGISYSTTEPIAGNVTAALTMADNYTVRLLNNNQLSSYEFNSNGEFEFILADEAGNKTRVKAIVSNIDREPPKASVEYSLPRDLWTNQSITATLHLEDINGCRILSEGGNTHTFHENGEFVFRFEDGLGNQGSIKAEVKNIDKTPPVGSIIYSHSDMAPVTVYLSVYEPVKVMNNAGSFRYVFEENGEFTFRFEDKAGNTGEATAEVSTITSADKYVDVSYSDSGRLTKENIDAVFTAFSGLSCITSPTVTEEVYGPYIHSFMENGDWPVSIRVLTGPEEGSVRTAAGSIYNIDRVPPEAELYISAEEITNEDVTVILLPYDDKGKTITIAGGKSVHVFEENGTYTFEFTDEAGNIGYKAITVSNIDKTAPVGEIRYFTVESEENSVFAEVYFPEETEVEILNNNSSNIYEFVENGTFTFKFADKAGNIGEAAARVNSFPGSLPAGTIEYYIDGIKVEDPDGAITNKNIVAKLFLDEAGGPYTIVNNGGGNSYTFMQNGEFTFIYEDSGGYRGFATAKVSSMDTEAPKLQISADIVKATNKDVAITVTYSDNKGIDRFIFNGEAAAVAPEGKYTYICTENKTIRAEVSDAAGNVTVKEFNIDYIDKAVPVGTIVYSPNASTNQDVKAVLKLSEPGLILNNGGKMEYVFTQNGEFTFEFSDIAGNKASAKAAVNWIDKLPPKLTLEYSSKSATNKPVEVTLKADEPVVILNNGGAAKRTFYVSGEFTFRVMDHAGNEVSIKAEVWNVDSEKPLITLNDLSYISIMQGEAYTEPGYSAVDNMDGDITGRVVTEGSVNAEVPGVYMLKYKVADAVGNVSEKIRTVKVIGRNEIVLLLNGEVVEGESVILYDSNVNADVIGNEGSCLIKWAEGRRTRSYFKSEGNIVEAGRNVILAKGKWYTFFVQDRERNTKTSQIYINE